ncbi:hypothetical protein AB0H73_10000 [Streptomyces olivoreticuli]
MISGDHKTARLRTRYTGEPKLAALDFFRQAGLYFGLVPDAVDAGQRRLEAVLLRTLAREHPALPELSEPGSVWGLAGVSPAPDSLVLWPAPGQAAGLLMRWLPTRTREGALGGVPGLRAAPLPSRRRDTLSLALAGRHAHVELRTEPAALREAARLAAEAGLEILWEVDAASRAESEAFAGIAAELDAAGAAVWSRALRRLGVAREVFGDWRSRDPLDAELEGPKPERIAPRATGPGVGLRGVVAVISGDGRGGQGCTTTAYLLAAAAAAGGARVGFLAGADPSNLLARLGMRGAAATKWHDVSGQMPAGGRLEVAVVPADQDEAADQLTAARQAFDVVIIDGGGAFQQSHLAAHADTVLALVPDRGRWYAHEVLDDRSTRVQIWSHLSDEVRPRPAEPDLASFLDEAFERYVEWRARQEGIALPEADDEDDTAGADDNPPAAFDDAEDRDDDADGDGEGEDGWEDGDDEDEGEWWEGWVEPYDPQDPDPDDVEMFWSRKASAHVYEGMSPVLPPEEDAPYLDPWRTEFLEILAPEGERRHPGKWLPVAASWRERNRIRNLERVPAGALTATERAAEEQGQTTALASQAIERWGEQDWQRESTGWLAAGREERYEVCHAEDGDDLVWTVHHPRPAQDIAGELRALAQQVPLGRPVVLAVNQPRQDLDRHLLDEVTQALQDQGIAGLGVIPRSKALQDWTIEDLPTPVLATGWTLAAALVAVQPQP